MEWFLRNLFDAEAFTVHVANVELGGHVAFFSGFFQEQEAS